MSRPPVSIRAYDREIDESFVIHSWLRHYHQSTCAPPKGERSKKVKHMTKTRYYKHFNPLVNKLLKRKDTDILIACGDTPEDKHFIYGWVCFTLLATAPAGSAPEVNLGFFPVLHYMYVKDVYRRAGVARMLAATAGVQEDTELVYTFNADSAKYLAPKVKAAEFMPIEEFLR